MISVLWQINFIPNNTSNPTIEYKRSARFQTIQEAQLFVTRAPLQNFECHDSLYGQHGICKVLNIHIGNK